MKSGQTASNLYQTGTKFSKKSLQQLRMTRRSLLECEHETIYSPRIEEAEEIVSVLHRVHKRMLSLVLPHMSVCSHLYIRIRIVIKYVVPQPLVTILGQLHTRFCVYILICFTIVGTICRVEVLFLLFYLSFLFFLLLVCVSICPGFDFCFRVCCNNWIRSSEHSEACVFPTIFGSAWST